MRRAANISGALDRVGRGIDEGHRVAADRNHRNGPVIGREAMPWTSTVLYRAAEISRLRIAEPDNADQLIVDGSVTETVLENCSAE